MNITKTPGRASFAGVAEQVISSPWRFKDFASHIMPDREKALMYAIINAVSILMVILLMATLYGINAMFMPFFRPLLLALLFGSFIHPMKRSLSVFFKQVLKEICEDDVPILAGLTMPVKLFDRITTRFPLQFLSYIRGLGKLGRKIFKGDVKSAVYIGIGAISLTAVGGDSLVKFVILINLISLISDTSRKDTNLSDAYLYFLIRSFALLQICWLYKHIIYLLLPIIILLKAFLISLRKLYALVKVKVSEKLNLLDLSSDIGTDHPTSSNGSNNLFENIYKPLSRLFRYLVEQSDDSLDTISSACVIGLMALIVVITTLFFSFHIYSESAYLIERVSISANDVISNNPDLKALLPENFTGVLDGAVKNTYHHGREWIRVSTRQLLNNAALDESNTTLIEKQMVEFWDRAYALYTNNSNLDSKTRTQEPYDWDRLFHALQSLNFTLCAQIFKQNWDTLLSVMNSIMKLLKGNLSLATSLITATISILIMSGSALLNFIMQLIIFVTSLFYLLTASQEQYMPIELVKSLIPADEQPLRRKHSDKMNKEIFDSVDESINAVFTASLKMMAFHGLSTWLLHRLFELEVVYIPSVISAVLGAVPIIAPYWASVPACIDLWLSRQRAQSILMLSIAFIPSSFVTTAFYSEIKNAGHPYLTGLAIAGGVLIFGFEGALFGPMLLVFIRLIYIISSRLYKQTLHNA